MTTNIGNSSKVFNTRENRLLKNETMLRDVFDKIINDKISNRDINIEVDRYKREKHKVEVEMERKDFADQILYYRKKLGLTQKEVGKVIGVTESSYSDYERKITEIRDPKKINKIIKFLQFEEEPILSDYVRFSMSNPEKQLERFLIKNRITYTEFGSRIGITERTIRDWFNGKKTISKESFEKIEKFVKEFNAENNINEEEEEME